MKQQEEYEEMLRHEKEQASSWYNSYLALEDAENDKTLGWNQWTYVREYYCVQETILGLFGNSVNCQFYSMSHCS